MYRRSLGDAIWGLAVAVGLVGCGDDAECGVADPAAAVEAARAGDVVDLEGCTVVGPVAVRAGVTVQGSRDAPVVFEGPEGALAAVELGGAGAGEATLRHAVVTGRARFAVLARDSEAVRLERVRIAHEWGVGALFDDVRAVTLDTVSLRGTGPRDAAAAEDLLFLDVAPVAVTGPLDDCPAVGGECSHGTSREATCSDGRCGAYVVTCDCGVERTVVTTTGLFADGFDAFTARDVEVAGYAQYGAVLVGAAEDSVDWRGGGVREIHGVALYLSGPTATLDAVGVSDVFQGFRAVPGFGLLEVSSELSPGAVETQDLSIERAEGYGIYQVGADNTHRGLAIRGARDAGYWALRTGRIGIEGGELAGNGLTAMMFQQAGGVTLSGGLVVRDTVQRRTTIGGGGLSTLEAGDGLQLIDTTAAVELDGVDFVENERVGLFYDGGEGFDPDADLCRGGAGVCFRDVLVEGVGDQRGALAGDPGEPLMEGDDVASYRVVAEGAWTGSLVRAGSAEDDVGVEGLDLDFVGVTGPLDFPDPTAVTGPLD